MKHVTDITSPFWFIGRFFKVGEWQYWNPLLWNADRKPRWFYSVYIRNRKPTPADIDVMNELLNC